MHENGPQIINKCTEETDLGVIFDEDMSFDKHLNKTITKANQILGIVKRTFISKHRTILLNIYKTIIRPHLEYANIIWSPHLKRQSIASEKIQRKATKNGTGIKKFIVQSQIRSVEFTIFKV